MLGTFSLPPKGFGPGSQPTPAEGAGLDFLPMPSGMRTYETHLPEIADAGAVAPALALLGRVADAAASAAAGGGGEAFDAGALDARSRALVAEVLGEGEVAVILRGLPEVRAQEAVFAGIWTVRGPGIDRIEVAPVPRDLAPRAHEPVRPGLGLAAPREGVVNAPALVTELDDQSRAWAPGAPPHVVNLTLLPHTPGDLAFVDAALGAGAAAILSRGYGNCRITATAMPRVWRVQYFNSMDTLILDTFEVTDVPEVACAAAEDFADSAVRLRDVIEAVR